MTTAVAQDRSSLPYMVLGAIALAIAWGLYVSGLGTDILRYKKDILYLSKQHLFLVAISGSLAIVFGIAVGIWLSRPWMARWSDGVIQAVNMITSIPTLGKLALMMSLLGIGPLPAIVGLWIATLLPIIRNTYEGIRAVPAHMVDAARGMGMSNNEILKRVELPNALFVIFAGVRTAMAVQSAAAYNRKEVHSCASRPDAAPCGLRPSRAKPAAAASSATRSGGWSMLAVAVDFLFGQAQYWLVPRGVNPLRNF